MEIHKIEGSGAPTFTPPFAGIHYTDIDSKVAYISVGTDSVSDWILWAFDSRHLSTIETATSISMQDTDYLVIITSSVGGAVDITAPNPLINTGKDFEIYCKDVTNIVRIIANNGETFNGQPYWEFTSDDQCFTIRALSDGNWVVR